MGSESAGRPSGIGAGSMLAAARPDHPGARCRRGVGDAVGVEYVSRVPRPPLDGLIDDLYYLEGTPPYARLTLPPAPAALLIVNLGAPFRIRAGTDIETAEYADGCVVTMPTRALEFGYPLRTRSVGVHFKPWGLAPFLPMPAAELCDRPVTVEQVWGRPAIAELRDRLATADGPHEMLTLLEEELLRRLCETAGLGLVRPYEQRHRGGQRGGGDRRPEGGSRCQQHSSGTAVQGAHRRHAEAAGPHLPLHRHRVRDQPRRTARLGRPRRWRRLLRPGHFGHEFRAFTRLTPTRYVEVRRRFLREHPGHALDGWPLPAD